MRNTRLQIGIIGVGGRMTELDVERVVNVHDLNVVAVSDLSVSSHSAISGRRSDDVVYDTRVEALIIDARPTQMKDLLLSVIDTGKPALCRLPFCATLSEAREVLVYAKKKSASLFFYPSARNALGKAYGRKIISEGQIGDVVAIDAINTSQLLLEERTPTWLESASSIGIDILEMAAYAEIFHFWVGPYRHLDASANALFPSRSGPKIPQCVMISGVLENGALGVEYHSGVSTLARNHELITVYGTAGMLRVDFAKQQLLCAKPGEDFLPVDCSYNHTSRTEQAFVEFCETDRKARSVNADLIDIDAAYTIMDKLHRTYCSIERYEPWNKCGYLYRREQEDNRYDR